MKKTAILIAFLLILGGLLTYTVFGKRGLLHLARVKEELRLLKEVNTQLEAENLALRKEIELLKTNPEYIEDLAREELGLVKENELIYQLKKNKIDK
jgi:cell division protein FtsB